MHQDIACCPVRSLLPQRARLVTAKCEGWGQCSARGVGAVLSRRRRNTHIQFGGAEATATLSPYPATRMTAFRVGRRTGMLAEEEVAMKYKVAIYRSDEGVSVSVPALPGCWSEGDTEEEALANIRDAIQEYLAALEDRLQGAEVRELEV